MGQFLDALKEIALADTDKTFLAELAAKYPDLDKQVVSAAVHNAVVTSSQDLTTKLAANQEQVDAINKWYADHWDPTHNTTKQSVQLQDRNRILGERVATLEAAIAAGEGGNSMPFELEQLKEFLKAEGVVTSSQLTGLAKAEDVAGVKNSLNQQAVNFEHIFYEATPLVVKFQSEFGSKLNKTFDLRGFMNFTAADPERMKDFGKAYEDFVAPLRQELSIKEQTDKLAADRAAFEAEVAAAATAAASHSATEGAGDMEAGHFAQRLQNNFKPSEGSGEIDLPLSNMNLSAIAAEQHRKGITQSIQ